MGGALELASCADTVQHVHHFEVLDSATGGKLVLNELKDTGVISHISKSYESFDLIIHKKLSQIFSATTFLYNKVVVDTPYKNVLDNSCNLTIFFNDHCNNLILCFRILHNSLTRIWLLIFVAVKLLANELKHSIFLVKRTTKAEEMVGRRLKGCGCHLLGNWLQRLVFCRQVDAVRGGRIV